jgi:chorismate dehydratase
MSGEWTQIFVGIPRRLANAMSLKIGAVSYLNTKPLIHGLQHRMPDAELILDLPSRLADQLRSGQLDVALIPSVEFLRSRDWHIVSDACIACRGQVRSVRILFRKPPASIRTLALDEGSRTSVVLARVLLEQKFGLRPQVQDLAMQRDFREDLCDAAVVIGDRAMDVDASQYHSVWDLGEVWNRETGLPFVFAMWVTSDPSIAIELSTVLEHCRDHGLREIDSLVSQYAGDYHLSSGDCKKYFLEQLHFHLGKRELAGLELFRNHAIDSGLIPASSNQLSLQPL